MCLPFSLLPTCMADDSVLPRIDDVETKLVDTEKEADKSRKYSKNASHVQRRETETVRTV
jgi:hypothetical protein